MKDTQLSSYGEASSVPSPVGRMMDEFARDFREGVDINLGVGYVNEQTVPRELIQQALATVAGNPDKYKAPFNYGGPAGSPNLIGAIGDYLRGKGGAWPEVLAQNRIIVGPSGATSLLEGIAHLLPRGIVITSDPIYYIYCNFLERMGFELVAVAEDNDGIRTDELEARLDRLGSRRSDIQFLYIVSVNNPTCSILSPSRKLALVDIAHRLSSELNRKIPLIVDRAYEDLIHGLESSESDPALAHDKHGIVYEIGTMSKILAPSLRIGYMIGRDTPFLRAMIARSSDVGFSAPLITQEIVGLILEEQIIAQIERVKQGYRQKAIQVRQWIDAFLEGAVASCNGGQAGFYFYLTFRQTLTTKSSKFFKYLSRTTGIKQIDGPPQEKKPRVVYLPGEYCVHPRGELAQLGRSQLRLSYGFEQLDCIRSALMMMREAIEFSQSRG